MDVTLDEFLTGILAVLAYRGRARLTLVSGVFEAALQDALKLTAKQAERERLDVRFRIADDAMQRPSSNLGRLVDRLVGLGVLRPSEDPERPMEIAWQKEQAYAYLARTPVPVQYLERAAKFFVRSMETRRIRRSLHRLATRSRSAPPAP